MATDVTDNLTSEPDVSEFQVIIATTTTSTFTDTTLYDDTRNVVAPQTHDNATTSINTDATNFTATTLTQLLNKNVTAKVVEAGSLSSTLNSENVTFSSETTLSQFVPSSSSSAFLPVVPVETSTVVENVQTLSPESSFNATLSSVETTSGYLSDVDVQPASTIGIAVGVAIGGFILLALIVVVIVFFVRRRRITRKKENKVVIENPRYTLTRDSTLPRNFDLTMHTGPMMRNQLNNNSSESLGRTNGRRKKEAPQPPIYRPLGGKDSGSKRKAPSPPTRLGYEDLYEKDSAPGSTENLELTSFLTVDNCNADPVAIDSETSHSQPLLETFKPDKKSPKRNSKVDSGEQTPDKKSSKRSSKADSGEQLPDKKSSKRSSKADSGEQLTIAEKSPKRSSNVDSGEQPAVAEKSSRQSSKVDSVEQPAVVDDSIKQVDDDEDKDDDEEMKTALLGKIKADSHLSLDSYDREKNPFFEK